MVIISETVGSRHKDDQDYFFFWGSLARATSFGFVRSPFARRRGPSDVEGLGDDRVGYSPLMDRDGRKYLDAHAPAELAPAASYEQNVAIVVCTGIRKPLAEIWPGLKEHI